MTGVRLVAIDLDGTLIGESLTISEVDRQAIERSASAGLEICLATGRLFSASRPFAQELRLDGFLIPLNGAAVFDVISQTMVHAVPLDKEVALLALDALRAADFRVQLYFGDLLYLDGMDARAERYLRQSRVEPVMVPDLRMLLTGAPPAAPGPMKVLGIGTEAAVIDQIAVLGARFGRQANVFRSQRPYLEITDPSADKGSALQWVARQRGLDRDAVAAIGDSDNDVPMFAWAARSFAVSGATPNALKAAGKVVGPLGSGVSEALVEILEGVACEQT